MGEAGSVRHTPWCSWLGLILFMWLLLHPVLLRSWGGEAVSWARVKTYSTAPATDYGKERKMVDRTLLTEEEGKILLGVARKTIEAALSDQKGVEEEPTRRPPVFQEKRGTFVTLTMEGNLRGCIGHIEPQETLLEGIKVNAINAAFRDPRFRPLTRSEWDRVSIEISILTAPQPLPYSGTQDLLNKLRADVDGVILKKGFHQSTFLPQVWEQLPDKAEFLTHLCLKAGLAADAWKQGDVDVLTYQVQAFEE